MEEGMSYFLYDMTDYRFWVGMAYDWPLGTLMFVLCFVLCVILAVRMLQLLINMYHCIYCAVDTWGVQKKEGVGIIRTKNFRPAHTVMILYVSLNVPNHWSVLIQDGEHAGWLSIGRELHKQLNVGSRVALTFVRGRLSGKFYPVSIQRILNV